MKKNSVPAAEISVQLLWSATWEKELPQNIDPADWLRIDINRSASLIQLPAALMYVGINRATKILVASKKKKAHSHMVPTRQKQMQAHKHHAV